MGKRLIFKDADFSQNAINPQPNLVTITTGVDPVNSGTVQGGGTYIKDTVVQLSAIANQGYSFNKWSDDDLNAIRSIIASQDMTLIANFIQTVDPFNGHEYVDMGLPSGLLWAKYNVGTEGTHGMGDRFRYAETTPYPTLPPNDYQSYIWTGTPYMEAIQSLGDYGPAATVLKYKEDLDVVQLEEDCVRVNMGGLWRIPLKSEFEELLQYTTRQNYTTTENVYGCKGVELISTINGAKIFFPVIDMKLRQISSGNDRTYDYNDAVAYATSQVKLSTALNERYAGCWSVHMMFCNGFNSTLAVNSFHRRVPLMHRGIISLS